MVLLLVLLSVQKLKALVALVQDLYSMINNSFLFYYLDKEQNNNKEKYEKVVTDGGNYIAWHISIEIA